MKIKVIVFVLLSSLVLLNAQTVNIEEIGCKLTDVQYNDVNAIIEFETNFYRNIFETDNVLVDIIIFGEYEKFKKYQSKVSTTSRSNNGFYSSSLKKIIIHKNEKFNKTINHEVSHLILRSVVNPVPKWINEGLAELFEYFYISNGEVVKEIQNNKIERVKNWIAEDELNLKEFFQLSNKEWSQKNTKPAYPSSSISYCLLYFLYNEHPQVLEEILTELKNSTNSLAVINKVYPNGFESFNTDFHNFFMNKQ